MTIAPIVELHPFRATDKEFFTSLATDERVTRFVGNGGTWDEQRIQERIDIALRGDPVDEVGAARWFLATHSKEPVGIVVSTRREEGIEIGYWVSPDHWGRGIAGAMTDATLEIVPALYGTKELIARVYPDNLASAKVLTRRGFHLVGNQAGVDQYRLL